MPERPTGFCPMAVDTKARTLVFAVDSLAIRKLLFLAVHKLLFLGRGGKAIPLTLRARQPDLALSEFLASPAATSQIAVTQLGKARPKVQLHGIKYEKDPARRALFQATCLSA